MTVCQWEGWRLQVKNDNKALIALKQHIGFSQEPPDIDTAIESEYYLKNVLPPRVYPFWRKRLRELYPDNITTKSTYVLATGSIGGGKSTFSQIIILYDIIKMACMRDIREFAEVGLLQGVYIKCANVAKYKSQDFVDTLNEAVFGGKSPFFQRELERGNWFLNNLHIQATGIRERELVSNDMAIGWISECNQLKPEVALSLIASCDSRLTSRFIKCENICTHLIIDSSTIGTDAATEALLRDDPKFSSDQSFIVKVNSWNVTEGLRRYFNFGSFWVYCGDSQTNPFIVQPEDIDTKVVNGKEVTSVKESLMLKYDQDRFLECPNELLPEAERDIILFLQEKAGISTTSGTKFFTDQARLSRAFCLDQEVDDVIRVDFFDPYDTIMEKLHKDIAKLPIDRKLFIKIDCGLKSDLFGIAIAYADGVSRNIVDGADVERLNIKIPICFALSRYNGQETPINKVEDFFLQLAQTHDIAIVLTDQYQCFTGDTKVALLDGTNPTMSEIVERWEKGEEMFTYTLDTDNNKLTAGKIKRAWKTGNKRIMKVTLDNGEVIRCTEDHRFMLRDGSFCEAQYLTPGTSLMPLYRHNNPKGYEEVLNPLTDSWGLTYGKISNYFNGSSKGFHIHHADFNKHNNNPTNLKLVTKEEHLKLHVDEMTNKMKNPEYAREHNLKIWQNNPELRLRASERAKRLWFTPEARAKNLEHMKETVRKPENREKVSARWKEWYETIEGEEHKDAVAERAIERNKTLKPRLGSSTSEEARKRMSEANKKTWENPCHRLKMKQRYPGACGYLKHKYGANWKNTVPPEIVEEEKKLYRAQWESEHQNTQRINHKVLSIEFTDICEDVYDLEIDNFPNFALSSGVFVHNSSGIRQMMIQNGIDSKLQSVDRTDIPYITFKNYVYSGLVELPRNEILRKELGELEHIDNRVDHPKSGGKDSADCCCGLVHYMVELGPEQVLAPSDVEISEGIVDVYSQLNTVRNQRQAVKTANTVAYGSYYDYV